MNKIKLCKDCEYFSKHRCYRPINKSTIDYVYGLKSCVLGAIASLERESRRLDKCGPTAQFFKQMEEEDDKLINLLPLLLVAIFLGTSILFILLFFQYYW